MSWKKFSADFLSFSRNDRIAIIIIAFLVLILTILPSFFTSNFSSFQKIDPGWLALVEKQVQKDSAGVLNETEAFSENPADHQFERYPEKQTRSVKRELFIFDPNTVSEEDWRRLGIPARTISTIRNYLSKGGHFREAGDLKKVYGLHEDDFNRIAAYVRVENPNPKTRPGFTNNYPARDSHSVYRPGSYQKFTVDINLADTTAFIALRGIGSRLANRIVNFREKLGGFYSIDQVGEVFGLPDSTFQKIKTQLVLTDYVIRKININTAAIDELRSHPYIRWNLANAILAYRNEHGPFQHIGDLKNIMAITNEIFIKLSPYLSL